MKKRVFAIVLAAALVMGLAGCGGGSSTSAETDRASTDTAAAPTATPAPAATPAPTPTPAATPEATAEATPEATKKPTSEAPKKNKKPESVTEEFTLLDVTADMVDYAAYAIDEDGAEIVMTMFTGPDKNKYTSLFVVYQGSGDVFCGPYQVETTTDDDGQEWTILSVDDVYSDQQVQMGVTDTDDGSYIVNPAGDVYAARSLTANEAITYMGVAVAILRGELKTAEEAAGVTDDFSLNDVTADMVDAALYAKDENGTEIVLTMFTGPDKNQYVSLFVVGTDGSGDVFCGPFEITTETDDDGWEWVMLNMQDVYTGEQIQLAMTDTDGSKSYITNPGGEVYEAETLTAEDAITYMGAAVAILTSGDAVESIEEEDEAEYEDEDEAEYEDEDEAEDEDEEEAEDEDEEEAEDEDEMEVSFSLGDVTADMVDAALYAKDENDEEIILTMFTGPDQNQYVSLFVVTADKQGDVFCGPFELSKETDEDGWVWAVMEMTDVYSGETLQIGMTDTDEGSYIFNQNGDIYEAEELSAEDAITYMGVATAILSQDEAA